MRLAMIGCTTSRGRRRSFGGTPAQNLWGFLKKHLTSVLDLVDGSKPVTKAMVDEKVGDAINYLVLLEAVLLEDVK